jgi:plastocyanin
MMIVPLPSASDRQGQRSTRVSARACVLAAGWLACLAVGPSLAATVKISVDDGRKTGLADAVVSAQRLDAAVPVPAGRGIMDQRLSQFAPGVLPITVGSLVVFPNSDNIRHQVYSFSPAKVFDLPLYAGTPAAPLRFDTPGVVVIGCNIHDWMIGYIVVLDTPYFAKTDGTGAAALSLPPGRYRLRIWHPRLSGPPVEEPLVVTDADPPAHSVHLSLMPPAPPRRGVRRLGPAAGG